MSLLWQVVHRDLREIRVAATIFVGALVVAAMPSWLGLESLASAFSGLGVVALALLMAFLVSVFLVSLDSPGGDRTFWHTRPVRRDLMIASKVLIMAGLIMFGATLHVLVMVRQGLALGDAGLALAEAALRFSLPFLLGAATASLAQGIPNAFFLAGAVVVVNLLIGQVRGWLISGLDWEFLTEPVASLWPPYEPLREIWILFVLAATVFMSYRLHRPLIVGSVSVCAYWLVLFIVGMFPWAPVLFPAVAGLGQESAAVFSFSPKGSGMRSFITEKEGRAQLGALLHLEVPTTVAVIKGGPMVARFRAEDGTVVRSFGTWPVGADYSPSDIATPQELSLPREVTEKDHGFLADVIDLPAEEFDRLKDLRGTFEATVTAYLREVRLVAAVPVVPGTEVEAEGEEFRIGEVRWNEKTGTFSECAVDSPCVYETYLEEDRLYSIVFERTYPELIFKHRQRSVVHPWSLPDAPWGGVDQELGGFGGGGWRPSFNRRRALLERPSMHVDGGREGDAYNCRWPLLPPPEETKLYFFNGRSLGRLVCTVEVAGLRLGDLEKDAWRQSRRGYPAFDPVRSSCRHFDY